MRRQVLERKRWNEMSLGVRTSTERPDQARRVGEYVSGMYSRYILSRISLHEFISKFHVTSAKIRAFLRKLRNVMFQ